MNYKISGLFLAGLLMAVPDVWAAPSFEVNEATAQKKSSKKNVKQRAKSNVKKTKVREKAKQKTSEKAKQESSQRQNVQQTQSKKKSKPQPFKQGYMTINLSGGTVRTIDETQFVLGGGLGYFLLDGLELSASIQAYFLGEPTTWTLTPGIRYVVHQMKVVNPYLGAFYRYNFIGEYKGIDIPDTSSFGGRGGIYYITGQAVIGAGIVVEKLVDTPVYYDDEYEIYPEITFSISI